MSLSSLKCSEWLPWLSHAVLFLGADCASACSASIAARSCAIPAQPFTRLHGGSPYNHRVPSYRESSTLSRWPELFRLPARGTQTGSTEWSTRVRTSNICCSPEITLNPAMACFRCLVAFSSIASFVIAPTKGATLHHSTDFRISQLRTGRRLRILRLIDCSPVYRPAGRHYGQNGHTGTPLSS